MRRSERSGEPEREAQGWLRQTEDLESRMARALDLAVEGLMDHDTLRRKLGALDEQKQDAEAERAASRDRRNRVEDLETSKRSCWLGSCSPQRYHLHYWDEATPLEEVQVEELSEASTLEDVYPYRFIRDAQRV